MSLRLEAQLQGKPPPPLSAAFTYELCAGILDKEKSIQEVASEEVGWAQTSYWLRFAAHAVFAAPTLICHADRGRVWVRSPQRSNLQPGTDRPPNSHQKHLPRMHSGNCA